MKKLSHEHYSFTSATPGLAFDGNMVVYAVKEGLPFSAHQKLGSTKWENGDHDEFVRNLTDCSHSRQFCLHTGTREEGRFTGRFRFEQETIATLCQFLTLRTQVQCS